MKKWLALFLLVPAILSAQTPDSTRTYTSVHTDSVKSWYTRTIHDTTWVHDTATPPPPVAMGCPVSGWTRRIAVTPSTVNAALADANPGTQVELASGTYALSVTGKTGTASDSITVCGDKTASVPNGLSVTSGSYLRFVGFVVKGGLWCAYIQKTNHSTFRGLEVSGCGQEGFQVWNSSSDNVLEDNYCHDTGKSLSVYGECYYIGSGGGPLANKDPSNRNLLRRNRSGPNGTAEHYDIKTGTTGTVIQDAKVDGTGAQFVNGQVDALVSLSGTNSAITGSTFAFPKGDPKQVGMSGIHVQPAAWGATVKGNVVTNAPVSAVRDQGQGTITQ